MNNSLKIKRLTLTAILAGLLVVLAFLPIKIFIEVTFTIVPLVIGVIYGGPLVGLFLGFVFGIVSFLQCVGYSPFGTMILSINPFLTFLVCVPTRMAAGYIPGIVFKFVERKKRKLGSIICGILVPLLNTVFFLTVLVICFYNHQDVRNIVDAANPLHYMILFAGWNAVIELGLGLLTGISMTKVIDSIRK